MHVLIREIYMLHYERKENHVLVMAFTRCVRENVPLLQQYSRTHTFLFYFYFFFEWRIDIFTGRYKKIRNK